MRGRVLGWNEQASEGQIAGEDGQRYRFARADWHESQWPKRAMLVDFETEAGRASSIYVLGSGAVSGRKDKYVAALLAFLFGLWGVHKFYLGRTGAGIVMLLCGTIGWLLILPGLFSCLTAFIEFIIYLVIDDAEFQHRYVDGDRAWF